MNIALINEESQSDKNELIFNCLKESAESLGHKVFNFGMYSPQDKNKMGYVHVGLLAAVLLNSGAIDFVVTGCGTGEGVTVSCNSFPGVQCGLICDPTDAFLFLQINNGNAVALPYSKGCGFGMEINLKNTFSVLFGTKAGQGYPPSDAENEKKYKLLMDEVKKITHNNMEYILDNLDKDFVKQSLSGDKFKEYFFPNCKNDSIRNKIQHILNI